MRSYLPVVALVLLCVGCARQLETGLSEQDAQEIVVVLRENGISASIESEPAAKKGTSTWQVRVRGGSDEVVSAWKVLREHGLPREKVAGLGDVFGNPGLIATAGEEKARLLVGLAGELTRTLRSLPGVADARVHVVLPEKSPLIDKQNQSATTASVLVRYRGDRPPLTDDEIRALVAKGVEGLTPENVAIVQKRVIEKPLEPRMVGPLALKDWTGLAAVVFACVSSVGAITLLAISKQRSMKIRKLERQLAQVADGSLAASERS